MKRVLLYVPSYREIPEARESWIKQKASDVWADLFIVRYNPFPGGDSYNNLDVKSEIARKIAIDHEYDYFFNVEDDIVLPDNALELLLKENTKVVSGLYRLRWEKSGTCRLSVGIKDLNIPYSRKERPLEAEDIHQWGEIIECTHVSCGCLLIQRDVLPELEGVMGRDYLISLRLRQLGYTLFCHTGVLCGHVDQEGHNIGVRTHGSLSPYRSYDLSP